VQEAIYICKFLASRRYAT